jgi:hypothetical protein
MDQGRQSRGGAVLAVLHAQPAVACRLACW